MDLFSTAVIFVIVWWLVLFMVLPMGLSRQQPDQETGQIVNEVGAPLRPRLWRKMLMTTGISLVITALIYILVATGTLNLRPIIDPGN